ncbi:MAG: pitrilysin family protein [Candidatus Uhrbacteria bacterium]
MHQKFKLKNGIRVHSIPVPGTEAATVLVLIKVGSRYELPQINGASHFIEHLMFKGTKKRPSTLDISRDLDSVGAEFNAFTGKDRTGYYVKAAAEHLDHSIDLLYDMLFNSKYDPKEVKRERGVIIEEINMYHDNPLMYVEDLFEQIVFEGSSLGREIAGTRQTMTEMSRQEVIAFRDQYYQPSEIVIALAGKINQTGSKRLLEKTFGKVSAKSKDRPLSFAPFGQLSKQKTPRTITHYKKTKQVQIALGFPSLGKSDQQTPAAKLLSSILGGTMSSRLFISVRERQGLAYLIRASQSEYEDVGTFVIQAGLDISRLDLAWRTIIKEIRSVKKYGVTAEEMRRAKDNLHGKVTLALEDSMRQADFYAEQELFMDKVQTPKERLAEFDKVTRKQVQNVANQILDEDRLCIAAIGPYRNKQELLKHF